MPGDRAAIANVSDAIAAALTALKISEEKQLEITLAVQEALANAVVHGCNNDPSLEIRCRMQGGANGQILIIVTDPGDGFDPGRISNPQQPDNLYAGSGRGVYLIRQLMDEVDFENGGNEIRMWKY